MKLQSAAYDDLIQEAVTKHLPGYDWRLYKAQLYQESHFEPNAVSPVGAQGIAQFMPGTWEEWSKKAGFEDRFATDAEASIFTGACYMADILAEWDWPRPEIDRWCLALASYNAGLSNLVKAQETVGMKSLYAEIIVGLPAVTQHHAQETIGYVRKILRYWAQLVTEGGE